jgi:hypothetical protein
MPYLSDTQVANIVFNETRSLNGPSIAEARVNIAHAIMNAIGSPHKFPMMAPAVANPGPGESSIYDACTAAVSRARGNVMSSEDPTGGATHFNFRNSAFSGAFQGHKLKTSTGPLSNSYPTPELPASGIYANTYE